MIVCQSSTGWRWVWRGWPSWQCITRVTLCDVNTVITWLDNRGCIQNVCRLSFFICFILASPLLCLTWYCDVYLTTLWEMLHTSDRRLRGVRIAVSVYAVTLQLSLWTVTRIVINVFMCKQLVIILTLHCYYCQGSGPETFPAYLWSALSIVLRFKLRQNTCRAVAKHSQACQCLLPFTFNLKHMMNTWRSHFLIAVVAGHLMFCSRN